MSKKRSRNRNTNNAKKNQKTVSSNEINEAVNDEKILSDELNTENKTPEETAEAVTENERENVPESVSAESEVTSEEAEIQAEPENVREDNGAEAPAMEMPVFEELEVPDEAFVFGDDENAGDEYARYEPEYSYDDNFDDVEYTDTEEPARRKNKKKNNSRKNKKKSEDTAKQSSQRRSGNKNSNGFNGFIAKNVEFFKKNPKAGYAVLATACLLVIVVIVIVSAVKKNNADAGTLAQGVSENGAVSGDAVTQQGLLMDAYPEVNEIITAYLNASASNDTEALTSMDSNIDDIELVKIRVKSEYVESYDNVVCYTKPGPYTDSYIVYAVFDVKLYNWDVVSPGLSTLLVCTDETGKLYIYSGFIDENIADYINTVSSQTDVVDLLAKVDAKYHEVLDENIEYAEYIAEINQSIKTAVGVELAAASIIEDSTPTDADLEQVAEDGLSTFEVKVTDTVNVRASDSEIADKIDQVTAGTILNCYEQQANGWSKIDYNGEIAYISSQYLERLDFEEVDESQAIGTVKIKETVNIRSSASTDATILGAGYAGETYPQLSEDENGWTKIIYNGREAYVKSEYLE